MNTTSHKNRKPDIATRYENLGDWLQAHYPRDEASNSDINTRQHHITFFYNAFASEAPTKNLTLPELCDLILKAKGKTKSALPWLKGAKFGIKKNVDENGKGNCLRWDGNVIGFDLIELDYDGEKISFDEAIAILKAMKVRFLIYTSPSHTKAAPRWRILMPVSRKLPLEMRGKLVARVNGYCRGIFAPESFVLSQSYYYGLALDNPAPDHRAEVYDGRMIDLCVDDFFRFEKDGWPKSSSKNNTTTNSQANYGGLNEFERYGNQSQEPHGFEEHLARIGDGIGLNGFHAPLRDATAAYATEHGADFDRDQLKEQLRKAIHAAPKKTTRKTADITRYLSDAYLNDIIGSAVRKYSGIDEASTNQSPPAITATPFTWIEPEDIPPRRWLYRPHYIRQFTSLTLSTGGVGKSSKLIVELLALCTGWPLLGIQPIDQLRVWYFNGEDPAEELQRRFAAACLWYRIRKKDIGDNLFVDSGRTMPIVLAEEGRHGTVIAVPVIEQVIATIRNNKIDVLIIDPFVSTHRVSENDNASIERVAKMWGHIAEVTNCSIMLAHHTRKTQGGGSISVDDGRGASALLAAVRSARTLNTMDSTEATEAEISEFDRRLYFRSDIGKANLIRPAEKADWFKMVSVDLGNTVPAEGDDTVGVVTSWLYPVFKMPEIDEDVIDQVMEAIKAGGPWRSHQAADQWVGKPIAKALKIDPRSKRAKSNITDLIEDWLRDGFLKKVVGTDPITRKKHEFIEVAARPDSQKSGRKPKF